MPFSIRLPTFIVSILGLQALGQNSISMFEWNFGGNVVSPFYFLGHRRSTSNTNYQILGRLVLTDMSGNSYHRLPWSPQRDCRKFRWHPTILYDHFSSKWTPTYHYICRKQHWHVDMDSNSPCWSVACVTRNCNYLWKILQERLSCYS